MYATLNNVTPLPAILHSRIAAPLQRRHHVGDYVLAGDRVDRFNRLLQRLDPDRPEIDGDQLSSAARVLRGEAGSGRTPACLSQRMRRAAAIERMTADPDWTPANDAVAPAGLVVDYVRSGNDLIPDALPRIGRLDDAIVVDTAWPRLAGEVVSYTDYRRLRRIEAELRGLRPREFAFSRADWEEARQAEAAWIAHCRAVGRASYACLPPAPVFQVC